MSRLRSVVSGTWHSTARKCPNSRERCDSRPGLLLADAEDPGGDGAGRDEGLQEATRSELVDQDHRAGDDRDNRGHRGDEKPIRADLDADAAASSSEHSYRSVRPR